MIYIMMHTLIQVGKRPAAKPAITLVCRGKGKKMEKEKTKQCYTVAVLPEYYWPDVQGRNSVGIIADDDGQTVYYDSVADAAAAITELRRKKYVLANGEAARPSYYILSDTDGDYIASGRNGDMGNYDWDDCGCDRGDDGDCCGDCNCCSNYMINLDRQYVLDNAIITD